MTLKRFVFTAILMPLLITAFGQESGSQDTLFVSEFSELPEFDGRCNDLCWQNSSWHPIDQVWMPWGAKVDSADFYGRFKIGWSEEQNILCFLLEISDDRISAGYVQGKTAPIYNFDMFEVFIDEDRSGGYHVFDNTGDTDSLLGINAENAFAYHVFTRIPGSGETLNEYVAEDIAGTDWDHVIPCDYHDHFPAFVCYRNDHVMTWEFSLKVYDDTYASADPEASRIQLKEDKIMGLTVAYNDDDDPEADPKKALRDNFFGSVPVRQEAWNDHWKKADDFRLIMLTGLVRN